LSDGDDVSEIGDESGGESDSNDENISSDEIHPQHSSSQPSSLTSPHIKSAINLSTNHHTNAILTNHLIARRLIEEHIAIEEELLKQQTALHENLFY
jgi:hypothetical protein